MGRTDVHHHILPSEFVSKLEDKGIETGLGVAFPKWDVNRIWLPSIASMLGGYSRGSAAGEVGEKLISAQLSGFPTHRTDFPW